MNKRDSVYHVIFVINGMFLIFLKKFQKTLKKSALPLGIGERVNFKTNRKQSFHGP